jgi:hypothetical protein
MVRREQTRSQSSTNAEGWIDDAATMERIAVKKLVTNVGFPTLRIDSMKAIDRVMASYAKVHKITDEQADIIRKDLANFIANLLDGRLPQKPKKSN